MSKTNNQPSSRKDYDRLSCEMVSVEAQGVLCASRVDEITGTGSVDKQLDLYTGHAL